MVVDLFLVYQFVRKLTTAFVDWPAYKLGIIDEKGNILIKRKDLATNEQRASFGIFDVMILNLKKLLGKLPLGQTKLASYAAALWLIREWNEFDENSLLTEEVSDDIIEDSMVKFEQYITKVLSEKKDLDELTYQKKKEIEWELRNEPDELRNRRVNYGIHFDGKNKPWKIVAKRSTADKIVATLKSKGKTASVRTTSAPVSEDMAASTGAIAGIGVGPDGEPGITKDQQKRYKKKNMKTFKEASLKMKIAARGNVADAIMSYAKKSGGMDKNDMMDVGIAIETGDLKKAKQLLNKMDTDPREWIQGLLKKKNFKL